VQRFVTLTFNARLFPRFLCPSKRFLTIQQFCYPVQSLSQSPKFF